MTSLKSIESKNSKETSYEGRVVKERINFGIGGGGNREREKERPRLNCRRER